MSATTVNRRSLWFTAPLVMLLLCAFLGARNGLRELQVAASSGQRLAGWIELGYGLFGLLAAGTLWQGRFKQTVLLLVGWATLLTVTGFLAPLVWGGATRGIALLSAAGTAAVATLVLQMVRRAFRPGR